MALINQQVHRFASTRLGQQVGRGECFDLADAALRNAGAKSAADYGHVTPSANYVWGQSVSRAQARPGDIIQFRSYTVTIVTTTDTRNADGSGETEEVEEVLTRPHHTAIVDSASGSDGISVLEQNAGGTAGGRNVTRNQLYFSSRTIGPTVTHRGGSTITVRRRITVTGQVWFYRPQAR